MVQVGVESENGWRPAKAGADILEWVTVPGTNVSLQLMKGPPSKLLRAWAADWNAYIEPLRDPDSAGFTPTNSVATSNHLNGTAVDLNWNSHPFHQKGTLNGTQMVVLREMLDFYEDTIFWAGDWHDPIDEMHTQMGYGSWNNPHTDDVIRRKIRSDSFSTFRRGTTVELSKKDRYALAIINEGNRLGITPKGIKIALATTLVETNLTMYANSNVPGSQDLPHDKVGSDHDSTGLFQQRQAWGPLSETMDPTKSAALFFLGGHAGQRGLTDFDYNSDTRTPGGWAQAVQVSAFPDRYDGRYGEATQIYDRLKNITEGDDMPDWFKQEDWEWVRNELRKTFPNVSMYGDPNDKDTLAGRVIRAHAFGWDQRVESSALRGEQWAITEVVKAAAGTDEFLSNHAKSVLAEIEAKNPAALKEFLNGEPQ